MAEEWILNYSILSILKFHKEQHFLLRNNYNHQAYKLQVHNYLEF